MVDVDLYTHTVAPQTLTGSLLDADARTLQVRGLDEHGGGVQGVGGESLEAVLRQAGADGDLMLPFTGGCRGSKKNKTQKKHQEVTE